MQRSNFGVLWPVPTRWADNDHYGHVNNVATYAFFDTAVNGWLMHATGIDIRDLPAIGLVVETSCSYRRPLSFPDPLEVGLRVQRLGTSSVTYELAVFSPGYDEAASVGRFVHVYVNNPGTANTVANRVNVTGGVTNHALRTPEATPIPAVIRAVLEPLVVPG
jgi:acyl-CoA thioester hydrolase